MVLQRNSPQGMANSPQGMANRFFFFGLYLFVHRSNDVQIGFTHKNKESRFKRQAGVPHQFTNAL